MFVKPGSQRDDPSQPLVVRRPDRVLLRAEGEEVAETNFWHRRLRDGDVVLVEHPEGSAEGHVGDTGEPHPELAEPEPAEKE